MSLSYTNHIVAQGHDWIAIDKPINIGMHTEGDELGLVVLASQDFGKELWPVHRLDKVTSGLLLLATSAAGAARLSALFEMHQIQKFYRAQSHSKPIKKQGWIKGDMAKGRNGSWLLQRSTENPAVTRFISSFDDTTSTRTFLLHPLTGRTHQLRVALKSIGSPIDGDERYSGMKDVRTYLHAYALRWNDSQPDGSIKEVALVSPPNGNGWAMTPEAWDRPWELFN